MVEMWRLSNETTAASQCFNELARVGQENFQS